MSFVFFSRVNCSTLRRLGFWLLTKSLKGGDPTAGSPTVALLRLHPSRWFYLRQLPPLLVSSPTLGTPNSHGVTGGVYKPRERIHRDMLIHDY